MRRAPGIVIAALLVGCSGPTPPIPDVASLTPPAPATVAPSPTASLAGPSAGPLAVGSIDANASVVFVGDAATFTLGASVGPPAVALQIAEASVDFGDGSQSSIVGSCTDAAKAVTITHVYAASGHFAPRFTSARLCEPGPDLDLAGTGAGAILVLPTAPGAARDWPACTTFQLHMSGVGQGAGLGHVGVLVRLQNQSSTGCVLVGFPGIRLVSPTGAILPTEVHEAVDGDYLFPAIAPHRVALAPDGEAAFDLGYDDNPSGPGLSEPYDVACPPVARIQVVLPSTHEFGTAVVPMGPCEGRVNVSAIFPGRDWIGFP